MRLRRTVLVGLLGAVAGCFSPDYGEPSFACGPGSSCPSGYECLADGLCHRPGSAAIDAREGADGSRLDAPTVDGADELDAARADAFRADASPDDESCPAPASRVLSEGVVRVSSLAGATPGSTPSCLTGAHPDLFFPLELGLDREVTLDLTSIADTAIVLYAADCAVEVACANGTPGGERLVVDDLPAGSYQVGVLAAGATAGEFSLTYTTARPVIRPPNDGCAGAIALNSGSVLTAQTVAAARDDLSGSCGDDVDVVYRFDVPAGGNLRARFSVTNASGFDPILHAREGGCGGAEIECAQTGTGPGEVLDLTNLAPGTYHVWVEAEGAGAGGTFDVGLELLPAVLPPSNETCAAAPLLAEGVAVTGTTLGAADELALSCLPFDAGDTVHELTLASTAALLVTVTPTTPWSLATALQPEASCGGVAELSCVAGAFGARTINRPDLAAGTYDVLVDGVGGAAGPYSIRYETRPRDLTFGYWRKDSTQAFTSIAGTAGASQIAITTSATYDPFSAADENSYAITLPFPLPFYGIAQTQVYAHTNGFLTVGATPPSGTQAYVNDCPLDATEPLDVIALFWDDSYAVAASQLWTKVEGTAPHRRFVIEYRDFDVLYCTGGGSCTLLDARVTQQAVLSEDGDVELRYGPRTPPSSSRGCGTQHLGCGATLGIRGLAGTDADADVCNSATVTDGKVVTFIAPR